VLVWFIRHGEAGLLKVCCSHWRQWCWWEQPAELQGALAWSLVGAVLHAASLGLVAASKAVTCTCGCGAFGGRHAASVVCCWECLCCVLVLRCIKPRPFTAGVFAAGDMHGHKHAYAACMLVLLLATTAAS
jgi:hypothetical protein